MSPSSKGSNHYNAQWKEKYPWVAKHPTSTVFACCTLCKTDIHISSMGVSALESHRKGKKHASRASSSSFPSITNFFQDSSSSQATSTTTELISPETAMALCQSVNDVTHQVTSPTATISDFAINETVLKAEIVWALHSAVSHHSFNSSRHASEIFRHMFPDSKIAEKFTCGKTKLSYLLSFGLCPYFLDELSDELKDASNIVVLFDESFNHTTKTEQMDVHVRYWSEKHQHTVTRYLTSQFMGHCTSNDILMNLREATKQLDTNKVLQISMDGPHVNHKFYREYVHDREMLHPDAPNLIDIGSCGLHVVHGAFKTGACATGWKIENVLRSLWYLFSDSPARRSDYTELTGSSVFPLQFCSTRWIEDVAVANRALDIWDNVCKYVTTISSGPKSKIPKTSSYMTVSGAVNDPLLVAKLHVFKATAKCLSPFLESFQSDNPMVPFLAKDLFQMLCLLLEKFIRSKVLESHNMNSIFELKLDEEKNIRSMKHISIGFSASEVLKKGQISEVKALEFRSQCKTFYKVVCDKILERSPLQFSEVRNLDCLNPKTMANNTQDKNGQMLADLLSSMTTKKLIKSTDCDDILHQQKCFLVCVKGEHKEDFQSYDRKKQRLDVFLGDHLRDKSQYTKFWKVVKMLLILSHGQASIERGFSVSKDCLQNNMSEKTLVALRVVNDAMQSELGTENIGMVHNISITRKMIKSCTGARMRYKQYLEERAKEEATTEIAKKKKRLQENISECNVKKRKLETSIAKLYREADTLYKKAEEESDLKLLSSANNIKKEAKCLEREAEKQAVYIKQYNERLQKLQ